MVLFWEGDLLIPDLIIHYWLGEGWLINFIVAVSTITDQVNHEVFFEFGSVFYCEFAELMETLNILTVNVKNWNFKCFANVA